MKQFYCTICRNPAEVVVELPFLTPIEQYRLGQAAGSFSVGEIDQGIHCILPVTDLETGDEECMIFQDLIDMIDMIKKPCTNDAYLGAVQKFGRDMNIDGMPTDFIDAYEESIR